MLFLYIIANLNSSLDTKDKDVCVKDITNKFSGMYIIYYENK